MAKKYAIPDKLVAVLRPETTLPQNFTNLRFKVRPAFVADAHTNLVETARRWGAERLKPGEQVDEVALNNDPITELTVLGLEKRREGGVAIKVVLPNGWYVDLREEEFFEATILGTLHAGVIRDQFVWSRGVTQMRLVRVGSHLYNERLAFGNGVS